MVAQRLSISVKTVRATYKALRERLITAALYDPLWLGGAGLFLLRGGRLSAQGRAFLEAVGESRIFAAHIQRHAPRTSDPAEIRCLLFEVSVRVLCNIDISKSPESLYPEETRAALATIREIAGWIAENRDTEGFLTKYAAVIQRFGRIVDQFPKLLETELLAALKTRSSEHRHPAGVLYRDLRKYLLKNPL